MGTTHKFTLHMLAHAHVPRLTLSRPADMLDTPHTMCLVQKSLPTHLRPYWPRTPVFYHTPAKRRLAHGGSMEQCALFHGDFAES